jgi:hypothetical protein
MGIHRLLFDTAGPHAQGLHTPDKDVADRWAREAPRNAKRAGHVSNPYVVHFEPMHHGWPDNAAVRALRRLGADCTLRGDGVIEVRNPSDAARRAFAKLHLDIYSDAGDRVELHAPTGETHGLEIVRSVHRLRPDVVRLPDGSIEVRNIYHYPDAEASHAPHHVDHYAKYHPLISKRQWVKIPQVASKRHWIILQPEKTK